MKCTDIQIGLVKHEEEGFKPYWKGFLIYKDTPVFEVIGNQFEGKYGDYVPLNFVDIDGQEKTEEEEKKADIGVLNINSFKNKSGEGYTFTMANVIELFGMKFPVKGFIGFKNNAKTVRIEVHDRDLKYYESDEYYVACADKEKEPVTLILENPELDYTERDLKVMSEAYPEFEEWYKTYIESAKNKTIVSNKKLIMPSKVAATPVAAPAAADQAVAQESPY